MLVGLYMSAAGLQAQEYRQTITANNLANSQTTGFKRDLAMVQARQNAFREDPSMASYRFPAPPALLNQGGGVSVLPSIMEMSQGMLQQTGNKTDLALEGQGFFTIQGATAGQQQLTRDGRFLINNDGTLVTANTGRPVLDASGQKITLNPQLPVFVSSNGQITQTTDGSAGVQLGIVELTDPSKLQKLGGNALAATDPAALTPAKSTIVRQGSLEASSVDPITEMINMMEGQRVFEANAKMISMQDQTLTELNTIGRVA